MRTQILARREVQDEHGSQVEAWTRWNPTPSGHIKWHGPHSE